MTIPPPPQSRNIPLGPVPRWLLGLLLGIATYAVAFLLRFQEWPSWQDVEYRLGNEMLLATHDAYHWVAGAEGFEFGAGHPMSELLRILALITGAEPAQVAFWLPPVMASLVALLIFLWAWGMGSMEAGFCAGILASLSPGFLARTMLGYADTDLVTLFLPLLIGLAPAVWVMHFLRHPLALPFRWFQRWTKRPIPIALDAPGHQPYAPISAFWVFALSASGLLAWWSQEWHSMFPYIVRYNVALIGCMALLLARPGERRTALLAGLAYALPALGGPTGAMFPLTLLIAIMGRERQFVAQLHRPAVLAAFWLMAAALLVDLSVLSTMLHHVQGYLKRAGDAVATGTPDPLVFPSVAQSIIEIQDLTLTEILVYFHPWQPIAILGLLGFLFVLCARSGALFLVPLALLALLSTKMGGRMVMFGAPIVAIGLTLPVDWLACALGDVRAKTTRKVFFLACLILAGLILLVPSCRETMIELWNSLGWLHFVIMGCLLAMFVIGLGRQRGWRLTRTLDMIGPHLLYRSAAVILMLAIVIPPLADLVPAMTHGPILNRRHAAGLRELRKATPEDAMIWHWWDWGYAAHHFSRRDTIADGAEHGGPSLYLPAAVYATDDPRFARQIIKYTAAKGNVPGNVFKGLTASQAADMITWLNNPNNPLIQADGKQYLVLSFDMLDLGFWISTFGSWNFLSKEGRGYAISIVPQALSYRLDKGEVVMKGNNINVPAASIDVFSDGQLDHRDYVTPPEYLPDNAAIKAWKEDMERRRNVHFMFNRVTGEKLVIDDRMYNTLMVQLLICDPGDPRFAPYFRLIFDNVFCRVYEVL